MIFVTGATGFLGAHLLFHLLKANEEVLALKRPTGNLDYIRDVFRTYGEGEEELLEKVQFVDGDVLDYQSLLNIDYPVERIYHLAAMVSFLPRDKEKLLTTNVYGTSNVVNFALEKKIPEIVHVSSVAALDPINEEQRITEENFGNNPERNSNYAKSKFQSELEIWRGVEEGLKAIVVNPSVILGPGMKVDEAGKIFKTVRRGFGFYPSGSTGFVDVRDTCQLIMEIVQNGMYNERFIVNEGNYSYRKLLGSIAHYYNVALPNKKLNPAWTNLFYRLDWLKTFLTGTKRLITKELHRSMHSRTKFSNEKIKTRLNFDFIPIEKMIQDSIDYLIESD
ncbi:MAG: SDR family oxidoreductase [Bacteroidota bacterium]